VRTVPNLYPAFTAEDGPAVAGDALHQALPARGACEVIIHSPDHHRWLPYLSADQAALIMSTTWRRYRHNASRGVASVVVLYNHGTGAGASLEHPHGQLYATTEASPLIDEEVAGAARYRARDGGCVFCGIVAHEEADGSRLIGADGDFVMLAPWASREPFECWIIPREHHPDFGLADERAAGALGRSLRVVLWRISRELDDPDLNWYIHSLPHASGDKAAAYHWHVEIRPRIGEVAGFELATGTYINTVAPEAAAAALKARPDPGPQQQERFP
jgi:UDPglucose--hexose-1-phosphate uridylyltransferase